MGPCTFAFMAPLLAVVFKVGADRPIYASLLLLAYGVGHCLVIIAAGTFTSAVSRFLKWNQASLGLVLLKKACGILILLGGLYLIYIA